MSLNAVERKFSQWYGLNNPDTPEDLKPRIIRMYEMDAWGTCLFIVRIPRTGEIQLARVFIVGEERAEISIDEIIQVEA